MASTVAPLKIGDSYGGGIIAYIDSTGLNGLIAATEDQSTGIQWAIPDYQATSVSGTLLTLGSGAANTDKIIAQNGTGYSTYAAGLCYDYTNTSTGTGVYSDWYLPSKDELNMLLVNLGNTQQMRTANGFAGIYYWSSSEYDTATAWTQHFDIGYPTNYVKFFELYVRAVRVFGAITAIQATPTFSPVAGAVAFGTTVTITSAGADAIYYTTDGTDPATSVTGTTFEYTVPLTIDAAKTIKAIAIKAGSTNSAIGSAAYTQAAATAPSSIVLAVGGAQPVGGVTNVAIPAAGATDSTGAVTGWVTTSANKIKFTVTDAGAAVSAITINTVAYTSGTDYTIAAATPLTIFVTTTEAGKVTEVRTFTVTVAAPAQSGFPAFTAGTPATFGTQLTVGAGTLATKTNLTYKWYRSADVTYEAGTDTSVGTGGLTYTPVAADIANYLIVLVTSTDATGNETVATAAVVAPAPLTAIGAITGTPKVGVQLTAGALTPSGAAATAIYQWQRADTSSGTYGNISGATTNTYTPVPGDAGKVINVFAFGTGNYSGQQISAATTVVTDALVQVAQPTWSGDTIIWVDVANETSYDVQLYKGGAASGTVVNVLAGTTTHNFATAFLAAAPGTYTVTVTAKGNGLPYTDGAPSTPSTGNVKVTITALALDALVTVPATGATPSTTAINAIQYTGTIAWFAADGTTSVAGNFAASTVYVAKATLTAKAGYTLTGVAANSFTYAGATSVANAANAGVVTITFPATAAATTVAFSNLTANGTSGTVSTTVLTLTFGVDPTTLAVGNITVTGATKGTLTGTGTTRTLAISGIKVANGADVTVAITNPSGFAITPASRTVAVNVAPITVTVSKLTTVQSDENVTASQANQDAVTVVQTGNTVEVSGNLASLNSFTPVSKSEHKWVGLTADIGGNSYITSTGTSGTDAFTTGSYVLWIPADLAYSPITFTFNANGTSTVISVKFTTTITAATIAIAAPVIGGTPAITIASGTGYSGAIGWTSPVSGNFVAGTPAATVVLTAYSLYTFTGMAATGAVTIAGSTSATYVVSGTGGKILTITVGYAALAPVTVTASSNGIATATGSTTITLGQAITGLAAEDIGVYKGATKLVKDTGYTLSTPLTGTTFTITFSAAAALDNASVVAVIMIKAGYTINSGTAIVVANTIPAAPLTIATAAIAGVTAPVYGETPVTTATETAEYTAAVTWAPATGTSFAISTFTATITLTPKTGYTLTGVTANFFTVAGATTVANSANAGVVTAVFPATAATYTVTFDKKGGTGTTDPITGIVYDAAVTLPTPPTKALNTFAGWFSDEATLLVPFTGSTQVTANITVYAKWTADLSGSVSALAVAGSKVAGVTFDIKVTDAIDVDGTALSGAVAVTVTSDIDGRVFDGNVTFTAGAGTITIPVNVLHTAGGRTLTVAIIGVTANDTVAVMVIADAVADVNSGAVSVNNNNGTATLTITVQDRFGNAIRGLKTTDFTAFIDGAGTAVNLATAAFSGFTDKTNGTYTVVYTITGDGTHGFAHITAGGVEIQATLGVPVSPSP